MGDKSKGKTYERRAMTSVRFTDQEMSEIEADSVNTGKSLPTLLKEAYFNGPRPVPLFAKPDLEALFAELNRIGNNLNQIARRVNSGVRAGFAGEYEAIQRAFDRHWLFLTSKYCRCGMAKQA